MEFKKKIKNMPFYVVYFGGKSQKLEEEVKEIAKDLRSNLASNIVHNFKDRIAVIPIFELLDFRAGNISKNVEDNVKKSDAYIEIIGEGFGGTSFDLAYTALQTAKGYDKPMMVLAKEKRKATNPKYASSFLKLADKNLIVPYKEPSQLDTLVNIFLNKSLKGVNLLPDRFLKF